MILCHLVRPVGFVTQKKVLATRQSIDILWKRHTAAKITVLLK